MGIGALQGEFELIFRTIFASRLHDKQTVCKLARRFECDCQVKKFGVQPKKGLILHGPPGTGKTLIARQIGKMMGAKSLKIINGPELLDKYLFFSIVVFL